MPLLAPPIANSAPVSILSMNIQGIHTKNRAGKLGLLKDIADENKAMIIAQTESHLDEEIKNAEIKIEGFEAYRTDREDGARGGVIVYVKSNLGLGISEMHSGSIQNIEFSILSLKKIETILITIYRPPTANLNAFNKVLSNIKLTLEKFDKIPRVIWTGDLNFPIIDWKTLNVSGGSTDSQLQAWALLRIMDEYQLEQCVDAATRGRNILDLYITNDEDHILKIEVEDTLISDHRILNIYTRIRPGRREETCVREECELNKLNFRDKDINWTKVAENISSYNLETKCQNLNAEGTYECIIKCLTEACMGVVPERKKPKAKLIPRDRRVLMRRRKRLNKQIQNSKNPRKIEIIQKKVMDVENALKESYNKEADEDETRAVNQIKNNYKYFFRYARDKSDIKTTVGPFIINDKIIDSPEGKATELMSHFKSVYSNTPSNIDAVNEVLDSQGVRGLEYIEPTTEELVEAINKTSSSASSGPDGVSIVLLQKCSTVLAGILRSLWLKSMREGQIPNKLKFGLITAIFKTGDKSKPQNYRPITLSSHISKVFERIIIKKMTEYLDKIGLFNPKQHGFRRGRSTTSELLDHLQKIINILEQEQTVDVVYLDFAKAFDKVDHETVLRKLRAIGISGNLLKWLSSFLIGRKQAVAVEGYVGESIKVNSGVPQGTVLGPLLFLIHIADIDQCLEEASASSFADDTRIIMQVSGEQDIEQMQEE